MSAISPSTESQSTFHDGRCGLVDRVRRATGTSFYVCTLNLDHIVHLQRMTTFARLIAVRGLSLRTGSRSWCSVDCAGRDCNGRPARTDRTRLRGSGRNGLPIFLLGAQRATLDDDRPAPARTFPGISRSPAASRRAGALIPIRLKPMRRSSGIRASGARLCFLALGSPSRSVRLPLRSIASTEPACCASALRWISSPARRSARRSSRGATASNGCGGMTARAAAAGSTLRALHGRRFRVPLTNTFRKSSTRVWEH